MVTTKRKTLFLVLILVIIYIGITPWDGASAGVESSFYYVDAGAPGGDCSTWAAACKNLQDALDIVVAGDQIWVAQGTYKPSVPGGRSSSFNLIEGVELYGGFPKGGGDGSFEARDPWSYPSVLSGNIGNPTSPSDNCYHVVRSENTDNSTILDGFTIQDGNASTFPEFVGGGMYNSGSDVVVRNAIFKDNRAAFDGGGVQNSSGSDPTFWNVIFEGNEAGFDGGGMRNSQSSSPTLINTLFVGNIAKEGAGISNNDHSSPTILDSAMVANQASDVGGGIHNTVSSNATSHNSIFWGNSPDQAAIEAGQVFSSYSDLIQGGCPTNVTCSDLLTADPMFIRPPSPGEDALWGTDDDDFGDLRLKAGSPAIDSGKNANVPGGAATDLMGNPRFSDGPEGTTYSLNATPTVDRGPYENPPARIYVDHTAPGVKDGTSWNDAIHHLRAGLKWGRSGPTEIWVAKGYHTPGDLRADTFQLINHVSLYGGFPNGGGDGSFSARKWQEYETVLTGNIGSQIDDMDNSYHVVTGSGTDPSAVLDGFSISEGRADGGGWTIGGGFYSYQGSPTLRNLVIYYNYASSNGGGMFLNASSPSLTNIGFYHNEAGSNGGGMYNYISTPELSDCYFLDNDGSISGGGMYNNQSDPSLTAVLFQLNDATYGGGLYNKSSNPVMEDVLFRLNTAGHGGGLYNMDSIPEINATKFLGNSGEIGGGIYDNESDPQISNSIFSGNHASDGGGMYIFFNSAPTLSNVTFASNDAEFIGGAIQTSQATFTMTNTILWGNTAGDSSQISIGADSNPWFYSSLLPDGCPPEATVCENVKGGDPLFRLVPDYGDDGLWATYDDDYGDLRLKINSPAIDAGDNNTVASLPSDLPGNPRRADVPSVADTGVGEAPVVDLGAYENPPTRLYVDQTAVGTSTGLSWTDAFTDAQDALVWGLSGPTEVWVAKGRYTPGEDRSDVFLISDEMGVYGGFPNGGGDGSFSARDWERYATILSGEIGDPSSTLDNSYQVVKFIRAGVNTYLDGFTVHGGRADGDYTYAYGPVTTYLITPGCEFDQGDGGGICTDHGDHDLDNLIITDNYALEGGGLFNYYGNPHLTNVQIVDNQAQFAGGGVVNIGGDMLYIDTLFEKNISSAGGGLYDAASESRFLNTSFQGNSAEVGAGIAGFSSNLDITNGIFSGNSASINGGGLFLDMTDNATLVNVTIAYNQASDAGGGVYNSVGTTAFTNTILWGNSAESGEQVFNSGGTVNLGINLVQGGCPADVKCDPAHPPLTDNPLFRRDPDPGMDGVWGTTDDDYGDLGLGNGSPAIDAGDNSAVPQDRFDRDGDLDEIEPLPFDLAGLARFYDVSAVADTGLGTAPIVDLGAYEVNPYWMYLPMILR
jgi:hypothetical protein